MAGIDFRDRRLGNYNVQTADNGRDVINALYNGDNRLGFLMKDQRDDGTRYGFGIDNINSRYRDIPETEINTPLGKLDYGSDYDTFAAGFTPNNQDKIQALANILNRAYAGSLSNYPLKNGGDQSAAWAGVGDYEARANKWNYPGQNTEYAAGLNFPDNVNIPDYYRQMNTPLGNLELMTNDGNPNIGATFQPNDKTQAYINALARLLGR